LSDIFDTTLAVWVIRLETRWSFLAIESDRAFFCVPTTDDPYLPVVCRNIGACGRAGFAERAARLLVLTTGTLQFRPQKPR
jgi:hypothetical protein